MTTTITHARLSPSSARRWLACPGSVREEAKYPDTENDSSIDGTRSHTLLASCLSVGVSAEATVGTYITDHGLDNGFTVDKDRAARVQVALDYVAERRKLYGGDCVVSTEVPVDPAYLVGRKDLKGTSDIVIEAAGVRVLEVIDYKDGYVEVPAEDNPQLELYALGALAKLQIPNNLPYPYDLVRMTIVQPKLTAQGKAPIVGWEMPVTYLLDRAGRYAVAAAATDAPDAPLVPGESQCRWCRAKGSCAALAADMATKMGFGFAPVSSVMTPEYKAEQEAKNKEMSAMVEAMPLAPVSIAETAATQDPNTLSDDKIRQVLEAAPLLRQFIESVEEEALRRLKSGTSIPGLKVVHGRGSRAWALPEEEMAGKLLKMGIPKGAIYETKLISPAKAEKVTWVKRDGTQKQLSDRQLKTLNEEYVAKMAGKLTVVPMADARQAVEFNAAPMFAAVEAPAALPAWLQ